MNIVQSVVVAGLPCCSSAPVHYCNHKLKSEKKERRRRAWNASVLVYIAIVAI